MERDTIEHQLFDWEGWDQVGGMDLFFYNVTLKVKIGQFEAGTKLPGAALLIESSILSLVDQNNVEHAFELTLNVGAPVTLPQVNHDNCSCGHDHG